MNLINIRPGFESTEIYPLDKNINPSADYSLSDVTEIIDYTPKWYLMLLYTSHGVRIPTSAARCISYKLHVENLCVAGSSERQVHREKNKNITT